NGKEREAVGEGGEHGGLLGAVRMESAIDLVLAAQPEGEFTWSDDGKTRRASAMVLRCSFAGQLTEARAGRQMGFDLLHLGHIHQLVIAGHVWAGPDPFLIPKNIGVGKHASPAGKNKPSRMVDVIINRHFVYPSNC